MNKSSIFEEVADICHDDLAENSMSCCTTKTDKGNTHCDDSDCCNTSEHNYKLAVEFEITKQPNNVKTVYEFLFEELIINTNDSSLSNYINIQKPEETKPKWGKSLLLAISNLKTEPHPFHIS